MGAQQSNETSEDTVTIDKTLVEQHMQKLHVLKSELVIKSEENLFLRRRIVNDLTEHASFLEEELKREKSRTSAQVKTIDKYSKLCRKLEDDLNSKKSENESLAIENNRLLFELLLNSEENPSSTSNDPHSDDSSMFQVLKLHRMLQQVKVDADLVKRRLVEEINSQKRDMEEVQLSKIIYQYDRCKEKLHNQGIDLGDTIFPGMENDYRNLCSETAQNKINMIKEAYKIESGLRELTEQLHKKLAEITTGIQAELSKYEADLQCDLSRVSFAESYHKERDLWMGLMDIARSEIKYFEKISMYGENDKPKQESYVNLDIFADNNDTSDNVVRSKSNGWPLDIFDESEA